MIRQAGVLKREAIGQPVRLITGLELLLASPRCLFHSLPATLRCRSENPDRAAPWRHSRGIGYRGSSLRHLSRRPPRRPGTTVLRACSGPVESSSMRSALSSLPHLLWCRCRDGGRCSRSFEYSEACRLFHGERRAARDDMLAAFGQVHAAESMDGYLGLALV